MTNFILLNIGEHVSIMIVILIKHTQELINSCLKEEQKLTIRCKYLFNSKSNYISTTIIPFLRYYSYRKSNQY